MYKNTALSRKEFVSLFIFDEQIVNYFFMLCEFMCYSVIYTFAFYQETMYCTILVYTHL